MKSGVSAKQSRGARSVLTPGSLGSLLLEPQGNTRPVCNPCLNLEILGNPSGEVIASHRVRQRYVEGLKVQGIQVLERMESWIADDEEGMRRFREGR